MLSSPHHQAQHANLFRERRWPCDDSAFQPFHSIAARTPPAHTAGAHRRRYEQLEQLARASADAAAPNDYQSYPYAASALSSVHATTLPIPPHDSDSCSDSEWIDPFDLDGDH